MLSEEDVTALHRALVRWRKGAEYRLSPRPPSNYISLITGSLPRSYVHHYYEEHKSAQTFQQELCARLRWIRPTNEVVYLTSPNNTRLILVFSLSLSRRIC